MLLRLSGGYRHYYIVRKLFHSAGMSRTKGWIKTEFWTTQPKKQRTQLQHTIRRAKLTYLDLRTKEQLRTIELKWYIKPYLGWGEPLIGFWPYFLHEYSSGGISANLLLIAGTLIDLFTLCFLFYRKEDKLNVNCQVLITLTQSEKEEKLKQVPLLRAMASTIASTFHTSILPSPRAPPLVMVGALISRSSRPDQMEGAPV